MVLAAIQWFGESGWELKGIVPADKLVNPDELVWKSTSFTPLQTVFAFHPRPSAFISARPSSIPVIFLFC